MLQLVSVKGGAKLDTEKCVIRLSVPANDDPHGIFALYSDHQSVLIGQNLRRLLQINVTRLAGTFGDVAVRYRISSDSKAQSVVTENAERQLVVRDGTRYKVDSVPVQGQVCSISFVFPVIPKDAFKKTLVNLMISLKSDFDI